MPGIYGSLVGDQYMTKTPKELNNYKDIYHRWNWKMCRRNIRFEEKGKINRLKPTFLQLQNTN